MTDLMLSRPSRDTHWVLQKSLEEIELLTAPLLISSVLVPFGDGKYSRTALSVAVALAAVSALLWLRTSVQVSAGMVIIRNPLRRVQIQVSDVRDLSVGQPRRPQKLKPLHLIYQSEDEPRSLRLAAIPSTYMPALWVALAAQPNHRVSDWGFKSVPDYADSGMRSEAVAAELSADQPRAVVPGMVLQSARATTVTVVEEPAEAKMRLAARKGIWKATVEKLVSAFQDAPQLTAFVVVERDGDRVLRTSEAIWNLRNAVHLARRWSMES